MHQWDDEIFKALREASKVSNKIVPKDVSHALIFFTAGEAVRQVMPSHLPYAEKYGVWQRGIGPFRTAIQEVWKPYLDGRGTRDETLAELVNASAPILALNNRKSPACSPLHAGLSLTWPNGSRQRPILNNYF